MKNAIPFHPRPDCPAVAEIDGVVVDLNNRPLTFPCTSLLPGCGGPNCRWARKEEYPLPTSLGAPHAAALAATPAVCQTCGGHGLIGGFIFPDHGYETEPCPDCAATPAVGGEDARYWEFRKVVEELVFDPIRRGGRTEAEIVSQLRIMSDEHYAAQPASPLRGSVNELVLQIIKMSPANQFDLAFKVAENIGYVLKDPKALSASPPEHLAALRPYPELLVLRDSLKAMLSLFDDEGNMTSTFVEMQDAINDGYEVLSRSRPSYEVSSASPLRGRGETWRIIVDIMISHLGHSYPMLADSITDALASPPEQPAAARQDRDETLRGLAEFFSESVHHVWSSDEIAQCLTDMISSDKKAKA